MTAEKNVFDFSKVKVKPNLTAQWILSRITDLEIFYYYHGAFTLNKSCKSPFDMSKRDTATFFVGTSGEIVFYTFRDRLNLNCFQYVMKSYNVSFDRALTIIAEDFGLIDIGTSKVSKKLRAEALKIDKLVASETLIQFTHKPWERGIGKPVTYWHSYEITIEELRRERVYCVDRLFINKVEIPNTTNEPRFAYVETSTSGKEYVKIYLPYAKEGKKWFSNMPLTMCGGLRELTYRCNLIVPCKSKKDQILMKRLFQDVLWMQNESLGAFSKDLINIIEEEYDSALLIFGSDKHAQAAAEEIIRELGPKYKFWHTPEEDYERHQIEDPAGYTKAFGWDSTVELFKKSNLIN